MNACASPAAGSRSAQLRNGISDREAIRRSPSRRSTAAPSASPIHPVTVMRLACRSASSGSMARWCHSIRPMPARLASIDGVISGPDEARIPVTDEGLLRGDGVFEVVRIYGGTPYALEAHWTRIQQSAANLRLPIDVEALRADVDALLSHAAADDAVLRVLVTRGGRRIALIEDPKVLPDTVAAATITFAPTRILDGIKSLSYGSNMLATRLAKEAGADEALLVTPHGRVLEGPTCSFFYALGGDELFPPPLEDHILDSITRRLVVSVTGATERVTSSDDLREMSEAFFASTLREVHPIHAIDGAPLPGGAPGPLTQRAAAQTSERIQAELAAAVTA